MLKLSFFNGDGDGVSAEGFNGDGEGVSAEGFNGAAARVCLPKAVVAACHLAHRPSAPVDPLQGSSASPKRGCSGREALGEGSCVPGCSVRNRSSCCSDSNIALTLSPRSRPSCVSGTLDRYQTLLIPNSSITSPHWLMSCQPLKSLASRAQPGSHHANAHWLWQFAPRGPTAPICCVAC